MKKPAVTPVPDIDPGAERRRGALGPDILDKLGRQLRGYYDGLIEPVPERFMKILRELDKSPRKESKESSE